MEIKKSIIVAGGAGFVGSHIVKKLVDVGYYPIIIDNMTTGRLWKFNEIDPEDYKLIIDNVDGIGLRTLSEIRLLTTTYPLEGIINLTCTGSSVEKIKDGLKTLDTCYIGTRELATIANQFKVKYLHVGSAQYGEPTVSPQSEYYNGLILTTGVRAPYEEGNRIAETVLASLVAQTGQDVRVARIYNVYGPGMNPDDKRLFPTVITQTLNNKTGVQLFCKGDQIRCYTYVDDVVEGIMKLFEIDQEKLPKTIIPIFNIGTSEFNYISYCVKKIQDIIKSKLSIEPLKVEILNVIGFEDPVIESRPDTKSAYNVLGYEAKIKLEEGLLHTVEYFINAYEKMQDAKAIKV